MRKGRLVPVGEGRRRNDRWVDPKGYVFVRCDPDHPNAKSTYGWIAEHVLVMSELLGRPLRPGESVHHRNLIKSDNRPGNLELWTSHQWTSLPGGPLAEHGAGTADELSTMLPSGTVG
jgi:hypothetical protein